MMRPGNSSSIIRADLAQERVRLRQVLAVGALGLEQVRHRVEPEAVDADAQPEPAHVEHRLDHARVLEVEVRLVAEEPVPEVLPPDGVERPVGRLGVDEDDAGVLVARVVVGPHVEVAVRALGVGAGRLEPRVLVARVVHDEVDDDPHAAGVHLLDELGEVGHGAVLAGDRGVVGDVVAAVAQRARVERRQPQAVDAEPLQVVEPVDQAPQVAAALARGVGERAQHDLVEHRACGTTPGRRQRRSASGVAGPRLTRLGQRELRGRRRGLAGVPAGGRVRSGAPDGHVRRAHRGVEADERGRRPLVGVVGQHVVRDDRPAGVEPERAQVELDPALACVRRCRG